MKMFKVQTDKRTMNGRHGKTFDELKIDANLTFLNEKFQAKQIVHHIIANSALPLNVEFSIGLDNQWIDAALENGKKLSRLLK